MVSSFQEFLAGCLHRNGNWLCVPQSYHTAFAYVGPGGSPLTLLALPTHIAAIKYLAGAQRSVCVKLLVLCVTYNDVTFLG